jgi:CRISPR type I-E-associated protein CasB/Cse2
MTTTTKPIHEQAIALARVVHHTDRPGEIAELRKLRPDAVPGFAFWRVLVTADLTPPDIALPSFISTVCLMAMAHGRHAPGRQLGRALAEAAVDEKRVLALLRASGPALFDQARSVTHVLDTHAIAFDHAELAQLLLAHNPEQSERIRRRVASEYFRASHAAAAPGTSVPNSPSAP